MASPFPSLAPDDFSGRKLGKYEIVCRLSTGGMSEIFLAFQRGVGGFRKACVLKQILSSIKGEEEFVRMFLNEAKITAAFNHPNIAHVYDLDTADGELFLSMEFVPGATLVEVARACKLANQPIPIGFTLAAVRDTALALHYAHTFTDPLGNPQPVIHRDIAEKNVMVTYEGVTKLLDFGIAKNLTASSRTQVGMVKGTSGYMSPEQVLGQKLDGRSDIFSLGVVLHECLTGMRLFHAKRPADGMTLPLKESVAPPSRINPQISKAVDEITLRSLRREKGERFQTALEMARALDREAAGLIWRTEQAAELIQRLFAERREQTRRLLSASVDENTGDTQLPRLNKGPASPLPAEPVTDPHDDREIIKSISGRPRSAVSPSFDQTLIAPNPLVQIRKQIPPAFAPVPPVRSFGRPTSQTLHSTPSTERFVQQPHGGKIKWWLAGGIILLAAVGLGAAALWTKIHEFQPGSRTGGPHPVADAAPGKSPVAPPEANSEPLSAPAPPSPSAAAMGNPAPEKNANTNFKRISARKRARDEADQFFEVKMGELTLITTPWAKVMLDGETLGTTPLFKTPVPVGKHRLKLIGPAADVHLLEVEITEGALSAVKTELSSLKSE